MEKIKLSENVTISRIVHGLWRLPDWQLASNDLTTLIEQCIDLGITTFDHADIYGNHTCEALFGKAFTQANASREHIQIVSKCGIKLASDKFPERNIKHYDYSAEYIIKSAENSLTHLQTDYLDVLLLHRPSPFFNPNEVAKAFSTLKKSGKVLQFGVSNFAPQQYELLESYLEDKLVTNQVEISPLNLEHFENNNIEFFLKKRIPPMAWSPLAGGRLFTPKTVQEQRLNKVLTEIAQEFDIKNIDKIMYAWLLKHPALITPIVGSGKIERITNAVHSLNIKLSLEQWFQIYTACTGKDVP